jgi:hypothetical protein
VPVAVVGHHDCAANTATREQRIAQIRLSIERIAGWGMPVAVIGLWVNEDWEVEEVGPEVVNQACRAA